MTDVPVTQRDREAAAAFYGQSPDNVFQDLAEACREGLLDDGQGLVYALARHRIEAENRKLDEAAEVAETFAADIERIKQERGEISGEGPEQQSRDRNHARSRTAKYIATTILALKTGDV